MRRREISASLRHLAGRVQQKLPQMAVHQHLTDAASCLDGGRRDGAERHLHAAIAGLAPLQLLRSGISDDEGHVAAKRFMGQAHRHLLLVKDNEDAQPGRLAS
jgi:hypothetical protein